MEIWYHGSDKLFSELRAGSTITRWKALAEAFSHKPTLLCIDDDGGILHSGEVPGYLYEVLTDSDGDYFPHPNSAMEEGLEFITARPLPLRLLGTVPAPSPEDAAEAKVKLKALLAEKDVPPQI